MRGKNMGTLLAGCVVAGAVSLAGAGTANATDCWNGQWQWENGRNVCVVTVTVEGNWGQWRGDHGYGNGCDDRCGPDQYLEDRFMAQEVGIPYGCDPWRPETDNGRNDIVVFNDNGRPVWLRYDDRLNRGAQYEPRRFHNTIWFVLV